MRLYLDRGPKEAIERDKQDREILGWKLNEILTKNYKKIGENE